MPFDGSDWSGGRRMPGRRPGSETVLLVLFSILAGLMLLLPISLTALADLAVYLGAP